LDAQVVGMNPRPSLRQRLGRFRAWTGLVVAPLAWLALQQGLGTLTYRACAHAGPPLGPLLGAGASLACAAAAAVSGLGLPASGRDRFMGEIAAGVAALLAFACALITLSAWLVPACAR
jgi:hypothetical protein